MASNREEYKDIPGTTVFDSTQCRIGYHLNMWCLSLMKEESREEFKADERAFLQKFPLSEEQRQAVLDRDYNRMISLGGNIYYLSKLAYVDGDSFQVLAAKMSGVSVDEFRKMMMAGGRSPNAPPNIPDNSPKGKNFG